MKPTNNQSGVAVLELVLIAVVLGIIGFAGWKVYDARKSVDNSLEQTSSQTQTGAQEATPINSTSDLDSAEKSLDGVNPDDSSSEAELDSQMTAF